MINSANQWSKSFQFPTLFYQNHTARLQSNVKYFISKLWSSLICPYMCNGVAVLLLSPRTFVFHSLDLFRSNIPIKNQLYFSTHTLQTPPKSTTLTFSLSKSFFYSCHNQSLTLPININKVRLWLVSIVWIIDRGNCNSCFNKEAIIRTHL